MQIKILLFATLKDIAGSAHLTLAVPDGSTVDDVRRALAGNDPRLEDNVKAALASLNQEYAFGNEIVRDGDEVAFFPPVSGGDEVADLDHPELFLLPSGPVNHDEIVRFVTTPATGAVCLFSGMVRGTTTKEGHLPQTQRLEYEAYEPMALEKMRQVAAEIRQRWPLVQGIVIAQRVGVLDVGQNTVLIACSSGHRDEGCFEAARYGIDRLKEIVPVWKKEVGPDGSTWIEGEYIPSENDRSR